MRGSRAAESAIEAGVEMVAGAGGSSGVGADCNSAGVEVGEEGEPPGVSEEKTMVEIRSAWGQITMESVQRWGWISYWGSEQIL